MPALLRCGQVHRIADQLQHNSGGIKCSRMTALCPQGGPLPGCSDEDTLHAAPLTHALQRPQSRTSIYLLWRVAERVRRPPTALQLVELVPCIWVEPSTHTRLSSRLHASRHEEGHAVDQRNTTGLYGTAGKAHSQYSMHEGHTVMYVAWPA